MSKLKRLLGALSLVSLFIFSSCVDDEIAPEVTALRQAQVDLLNADVAFRNAQTALENARVENQNIVNAHTSAMNALTQALTASNNEVAIAANLDALELAAETHAAALLAAEQATLVAAADLEQYLATAGLAQAQEYLGIWNNLYNGGTVNFADGHTYTEGIFSLSTKIAGQERTIALLELLNQDASAMTAAGNGIPQQVAIDRAELAITDAEGDIAENAALIEALTAAIAGYENPTAALEAQLVALANDTIASNAKVDSLVAAIQAIDGITADADSIVSAFIGYVAGDNFNAPAADAMTVTGVAPAYSDLTVGDLSGVNDRDNTVTGGREYNLGQWNKENAEADLKAAKADSAAWSAYAAALQAVYDEYYPSVEDYDSLLSALRQDTVDAYNARQAGLNGATEEELDALDAFAEYVRAERAFRKLGDGATATDTANYIAARKAWDGRPNDEIFNGDLTTNTTPLDLVEENAATYPDETPTGYTGSVPYPLKTVDGSGNFTDAGDLATYDAGGIGNPTGTSAIGQDNTAEGGALLILENATNVTLLNEQLADARFEFFAAAEFYQNIVNEFNALEAFITSITSQKKSNTTEYDAFPAIDLATAATFATNYDEAIDDVDTDDVPTTSPSAVAAAQKSATDAIAAAEKEIAKWAPFVADYLATYNSSVEFLEEAADSIAALKIAPEFALFAAKEERRLLEEQMASVQSQIRAFGMDVVVYQAMGETVTTVTTPLLTVGTNSYSTLAAMQSALTSASSVATQQGLEDALSQAQTDLVQAQTALTELEAVLEVERARLEAFQTELTVLEALAAEIQALVLAALEG